MKVIVLLFFVSLLWGQLGGIPLSPGVTVYLHDLLLCVVLLWFIGKAIKSQVVVRPLLYRPILLFFGVTVVSLVSNWSRFAPPEMFISSLYAVRWILYACLYGVVVQKVAPARFWLWALYGVGVGFAFLGLVQYVLYPSLQNLSYLGWDPHYYRVFSSLLDPNFTGILLVLALFLGAGLWESKKYRIWILFGDIIVLIAFLLTYSRSSFLAFIAGGFMWVGINRRWRLGALVLAAFMAVIFFLPQHGLDVLQWNRKNTTLARIENWKKSVILISGSPIMGYGFNTLRYVARDAGGLNDGLMISKAGAGVDSSVLFVLATTGILGLLAYGYVWSKAVIMAMDKKRLQTPWPAVYGMSLVAILVHSVFVNSAFYAWVLVWIWILTGALETIFDTSRGAR